MTKKYGMLLVGLVFFGLVGLVFFSYGCSNPFTPAGHEGFVYENPRVFGKGGFRGAIKGPGNYGASLWRNQIINIDMRPQTIYNMRQFKHNWSWLIHQIIQPFIFLLVPMAYR